MSILDLGSISIGEFAISEGVHMMSVTGKVIDASSNADLTDLTVEMFQGFNVHKDLSPIRSFSVEKTSRFNFTNL
jgi:hypothetical protein